MRTTNTGFKGIHRHSRTNMYEARVKLKSSVVYIGSYGTVQEAVTARTNYIINML